MATVEFPPQVCEWFALSPRIPDNIKFQQPVGWCFSVQRINDWEYAYLDEFLALDAALIFTFLGGITTRALEEGCARSAYRESKSPSGETKQSSPPSPSFRLGQHHRHHQMFILGKLLLEDSRMLRPEKMVMVSFVTDIHV